LPITYGVYDVTANVGFVSVGITSDTAELAVQSIRCWLERMGGQRYPMARKIDDHGGLRRLELARVCGCGRLSCNTHRRDGLAIRVHYYPPGTSKWNKIDRRLFCHIHAELARPAADGSACCGRGDRAAKTKTGLKVESALDTRSLSEGHQGQKGRDEMPRPAISSILNGITRSSPGNPLAS
jgi:hypothetical protein